jgi:hypothetical protein
MSSNLRDNLVIVVSTLVVATTPVLAAPDQSTNWQDHNSFATERVEAGRLAFEVTVPFDQAVVTLSGTGIERTSYRFAAGETVAVPLTTAAGGRLADGRYRYTLRISPQSEAVGGVKTGVLFVEDGVAVSRDTKRTELAGIREKLNGDREAWLTERKQEQLARFNLSKSQGDTSAAGPISTARRPAGRPENPSGTEIGYLNIYGYYGQVVPINFYYSGPTWGSRVGSLYQWGPFLVSESQYVLDLATENLRLTSTRNIDSAFDYNGRWSYHYNLDHAEGSSGKNVRRAGWANYDFADLNQRRGQENEDISYLRSVTISGQETYSRTFYGNDSTYAYGRFHFGDPVTTPRGNIYMLAEGYDDGVLADYSTFLNVQPWGVGVNTLFPSADLEIYDFNSFAAVRLNNYYHAWAFAATPTGDFTVNKIGTGGQEFTVRQRFDAAGPTMDVQGSVRGTQFIASSSRELKADFREIDSKEVLASLAEMPVMSWRYKTEDEAERHFGPVAEDFRQAFQLGDGKTIANIDADGVALAAIQGLNQILRQEVATKDEEIAELRSEIAQLRELVETRLAMGDNRLR